MESCKQNRNDYECFQYITKNREMKIINNPTSKFELLREKSILAILDGDTDFGTLKINGTDSGIKISMPYLSGPTLCDI